MPTTLSDKIESYNAAQVRKLRSRYRYELDIADAGETVSPPPLPAWVDKVGDVSSFYADVRVPMAGGAVGTALQYVGTEGESQQEYREREGPGARRYFPEGGILPGVSMRECLSRLKSS